MRVCRSPLNGHPTIIYSYKDARMQNSSNCWCSTENSSNNSWNLNWNNGTLNNNNNNNKYNRNVTRAVVEFGLDFKTFYRTVELAYLDCLKGKRSSKQAIAYMNIAYKDLPKLAYELWTGAYELLASTCFVVKYPKYREVFAANFRDRIVHHWVCSRLNPLFEQKFVKQGNLSHNCRIGFGTKTAVQSVYDGIKRITNNYTKPAWIFKFDLVSFFMSIDKNLLWEKLEKFIIEEYHGDYKDFVLKYTKKIIMHCPHKKCTFQGELNNWTKLKANKSLFRIPEGKGEPIGNLTTQLFANFLMSFFDQDIVDMFQGTDFQYTRFVDDGEITCDNKEVLLKNIPKIEALAEKYLLKMHTDKRYLQPASHGVLMVGTVIKNNRLYLANRTIARMKERINGFNQLMNSRPLLEIDIDRIQSVINSYLGFCRGRQTFAIRKKLLDEFNLTFFRYFTISENYQSIRRNKILKNY